ncbi:MAG: fused DSP-PTPase phosphatase/NAD kinase-like protein [Gaiella sp.]
MPPSIVPDSYWLTDGLAAGEYPVSEPGTAAEIRRFEDAGIRVFVDLTHPGDGLPSYERHLGLATRLGHPIPDYGIPSDARMVEILDALDGAVGAGKPLYVHCWGGIGRTGTVLGCWLVRRGMSAAGAIELIRERRRETPGFHRFPDSPQTSEQHRFVAGWRVGT